MQDFHCILQSCSFPGTFLARLLSVRIVLWESVILTPTSRMLSVVIRIQRVPRSNLAQHREYRERDLPGFTHRRHSRNTSNRLKSLPSFATDFTLLTHFQVTQFQIYAIFRGWENEVIPFRKARLILICGNEAQWNEGGGRILLDGNTGGGAVMLRPGRFRCVGSLCVCISCTVLYIQLYCLVYTQFQLAQNSTWNVTVAPNRRVSVLCFNPYPTNVENRVSS